jgi:hypothetical protein
LQPLFKVLAQQQRITPLKTAQYNDLLTYFNNEENGVRDRFTILLYYRILSSRYSHFKLTKSNVQRVIVIVLEAPLSHFEEKF